MGSNHNGCHISEIALIQVTLFERFKAAAVGGEKIIILEASTPFSSKPRILRLNSAMEMFLVVLLAVSPLYSLISFITSFTY